MRRDRTVAAADPCPVPSLPAARIAGLRTLRWFVRTHLLRRRLLTARVDALGLEVLAYARDMLGRHLYRRGVYEQELTRFVLQDLRLRDGAVALDIGANLGWYSLLLGRRFPRARIHAFEPEPRNLELLRENVRRNGLGNVTVHAAAVADRAGTMALYPYPEKNMGRHSLLPIHAATPIPVAAVRLDDWLADAGIGPAEVDFVKIDVEGYEEPALRGAARLLAAGPPILAEFAPKYIRRGGLEPRAYLDLLRGAGYAPFRFAGGALLPCPPETFRGEQRLDLLWRRVADAAAPPVRDR